MGAKTYRELVVFQRATELRRRVTCASCYARSLRRSQVFDQLRDAVRSPPRNIAAGFGRYNPAEFAQFMDVAISSLDEVDMHLRDGVEAGFFGPEPAAEAIRLCASCRWMGVRLRTYLRSQAARRRRKRRNGGAQ